MSFFIRDFTFDTTDIRDPQPVSIFNNIKTLEEGVSHVLNLSIASQDKLIKMLSDIQIKFGKSVMIFNPGVKSYESALNKVKNVSGAIKNQILRLIDGYRASILSEDIKNIPEILTHLDKLLPIYKFEKMSIANSFDRPWPNGYRDYNCRLRDIENEGLIGELQIHFCPIKFFSQTVGHKSYEILRTLDPNDPNTDNVKKALQTIATAGYNSALEIKDECCFDKIKELNSKQIKGGGSREKTLIKFVKSKKSKKREKKVKSKKRKKQKK